MHPALSIILFTSMSGLGYGVAALLGLGLLDPAATATRSAHVVALGLVSAGLLSSTLHLGNPQRAWRAFSQWRSSWLSREGVMAIVSFLPLCASAFLSIFEGRHVLAVGLAGAACGAVTVYCTAMIYASLRSVAGWHTPLTPLCYLMFGLSSGLVAATLVAVLAGQGATPLAIAAAIAVAAAWGAKIAWRRNLRADAGPSTPESATGLGHIGKVRQIDPPHMNENYLTREMGFRVARKHADKLWVIALAAGGVLPVLLLLSLLLVGAGAAAAILAALALLLHMTGILVERWLFFAEARHAVMNYYKT